MSNCQLEGEDNKVNRTISLDLVVNNTSSTGAGLNYPHLCGIPTAASIEEAAPWSSSSLGASLEASPNSISCCKTFASQAERVDRGKTT